MPEWANAVVGIGATFLAVLVIVQVLAISGSLSTILRCMAQDREELRARNHAKHQCFLRNPQGWREEE